MAHDIFLCYSRSDIAVADKLVTRLQADGWSVFQDKNIPVGRLWHKEIKQALQCTRAVVVLWSASSCESDYVIDEARYGKQKDILFPAFIEQVDYPYGFGGMQAADLLGWAGEDEHTGLAQLLQALSMQLGSVGQAKAAPPIGPAADPASPGTTFRDRLKDGGEGPLMVVIPAGRFLMGSPPDEAKRRNNEDPQHEVRIATPFAMGVHAVTFDDYERFTRATDARLPDDHRWGRGQRPVINVSGRDAQAYCTWLAAQSGHNYRLPSEAEWEYACRAGTTTPFHIGEQLTPEQANFNGNTTYNGSAEGEYRARTLPVGSFPPNAFGLHDMHGNVLEWCQDRWHDNYQGAPDDGAIWNAGDAASRVLRGGSWDNAPQLCRAASRVRGAPASHVRGAPAFRYLNVGFRVCRGSPIVPQPTAPRNVEPRSG